jgi:hypothetical protein
VRNAQELEKLLEFKWSSELDRMTGRIEKFRTGILK